MAGSATRLHAPLIRLGVVALVALGVAACDRRPEVTVDGLVHGCARLTDAVCAVDAPVYVWLAGAAPFAWSAAAVEAQTPIAGGIRYTLRIDPKADRITARRSTPEVHQVFGLAVTRHAPEPELDAALAAIKRRTFSDAQARLDALAARARTDASLAARVRSVRARYLQHMGQTAAAAASFEASAKAHQAVDQIRAAADDTIVAAFLRFERLGEPGAARRLLDALQPGAYPAGEARRLYFLGRIAMKGGDLRAGLRHLRAAEALGRKIGLDSQAVYVRLGIAQALHRLGRTPAALTQLEGLLAQPDLTPCVRALVLTNSGWFRHVAGEQHGQIDPVAVQHLKAAADGYETRCQRPGELAPARINLLLACLAAGDLACATAQRAALQTAAVPPRYAPWLHDVDGRRALAAGQADAALTHYTALTRDSDTALRPDLLWRAHVGRAEALIALGRLQPARDALEAAERLLDERLKGVPLHEGRESFVADRDRSARLLIDVLLRLDAPAAAFDAARRARARVLNALRMAERLADAEPAVRARRDAALAAYRRTRDALMADTARDAERSATALTAARAKRQAQAAAAQEQLDTAFADVRGAWAPTPRPADRLSVLYHPTAQGWVGFAARGRTVTARRLTAWQPTDSADRLGAALLDPFAAELRAARRVEFMPFGATRALDLHALPFNGRPLADVAAISYVLDLPAGPRPPARKAAVVIADPRGDLPAARQEADAVAALLTPRFTVEQIRGAAADPAALRRAAEHAEVLHYAGHGVFKGAHGWQSVLPLADGQSVGVGDILALRAAPRLVVLSGCETGRAAAGAVESLGLGQAFVAAGARDVIAAVRPVPDTDASRLIVAFHTERARGIAVDEALGRAQRSLRTQAPAADWAAFRLLRP